jgi:hypothetical protein
MEFTDQMAAKMLAHAVRHLGQALNETLCVSPDKVVVRSLIADVREALSEFEQAYFETGGRAGPEQLNNSSGESGTGHRSRSGTPESDQ